MRQHEVSRDELRARRAALGRLIDGLLEHRHAIFAPLRSLTEEQRAAMALLVSMLDAVRDAAKVKATPEDRWTQLVREADLVCAPVGTRAVARAAIVDQEVAYLNALADAKRSGKDADHAPQVDAAGAVVADAQLKQLEALRPLLDVVFYGSAPQLAWPSK